MFLHTYVPQQILGFVDGIPIYAYGVTLSCGLLAGYLVSWYFARRAEKRDNIFYTKHIDILLPAIFIVSVVAARVFFILYHPSYFLENPWEVFALWHGGWVWHGALFGGMTTLYLYCRKRSISFFRLSDILVPGIALGQVLGRWGNYFNQEAYGLPTRVSWGIPIDEAHRLQGYEAFSFFHPTFLYESGADLFLVLILFAVARVMRKSYYRPGLLVAIYLLYYSFVRFFLEFIRIDTVPVAFGLRMPQLISIFIICATILIALTQRKKKHS